MNYVNDEYTNDLLNEASKQSYSMVQEPSEKAYVITPKRYERYRDANWMP